jgi:hypothetical protein
MTKPLASEIKQQGETSPALRFDFAAARLFGEQPAADLLDRGVGDV